MGQTIELQAADGHNFSAYEASPKGKHRGGLVVIQEIFGVNEHMRRVADGYAADGYYCIAPAIFDRAKSGVELDYGPDSIAAGRSMFEQIGLDNMLRGGGAGCGRFSRESGRRWLLPRRLARLACGDAAARGSRRLCYYGGRIAAVAGEKPRCPVQMHFGDKDQSIPLADVEKIRTKVPGALVEIFVYPAGHAFNRDAGVSYEPKSAKLARQRTLELLQAHVG